MSQGALSLLALPHVRSELEKAGLDWKMLCAVALGNVDGETEVTDANAVVISVLPSPLYYRTI